MVLSDFLFRQPGDKSDLHQIIPISFNIKEVLRKHYQDKKKAAFMVQTRSESKGVKAPTVKKASNPSNRREQEIKPIIIDNIQTTPESHTDNQQNGTDTKKPTKFPQINQPYLQLVMRPPAMPPDLIGTETPKITGIGPNVDFEENSPYQEGIIAEMYVSPDNLYIEQPQELTDLVDSTKLIHKYLPKQVDIDKIMNIIKRKVLKGTHLALPIKEIQAGYLNSSFSKIYTSIWHKTNYQVRKVPYTRSRSCLKIMSC